MTQSLTSAIDECMSVSGFLVLAVFGADPAAPLGEADGSGARVTLEGQRGELDMAGERPRLRFHVLAHNLNRVAVDAVEVGVLFAAREEALTGVDPGTLYRNGAGNAEIGVVRQRVDVTVGASGRAALEVVVEPRSGQPDPQVFRTHVLAYHLADVTAPALLALLGTPAGADELAAVETLGLIGTAEEKSAVRARWGGVPGLAAGLATAAREALPPKPGFADALKRVYALRALGVLGGDIAKRTLTELSKSPELAPLDEALLVLLSARLSGSTLEAPVAFAVPVAARRMSDVVVAALADLDNPKDELTAAAISEAPGAEVVAASPPAAGSFALGGDPPTSDGRPSAPEIATSPLSDSAQSDSSSLYVAGGLLAASLASLLWWWRASRRKS